DEFARAIHETLDLRQTAYTVANEAQRLIGCDRVSVAIRKGNRCKIEAVSGQDLFDTRSNVVTMLGKLATKVVATGEPLWYSGSTDDMPPQVEDAIHEYVDHSHAKTIAILPLLKPKLEAETEQVDVRDRQLLDEGTAVGALIVEQIEDVQSRDLLAPRVDLVTSHAARALSNATEHHNVFLLPLWRSIGRARWLVRARTLPKTLAVVFGVLFLVLALFLVRADFNLEGRGELQPVVQREVFADLDGEVEKVHVKHGDHVKEGDTLAVLKNTDLEVRLDGVRGQRLQTWAQWQAATRRRRDRTLTQDERNRTAGEEQQLRQQLLDLDNEIQLLSSQQQRLTVRSPIEGMVVTWNVDELLMGRPVNRGERLMTVADTSGDWELEVYMPENRMGHILKAQHDLGKDLNVEYIVATDPSRMLEGTVHEVDAITQLHGQQGDAIQSVRIRVKINKAELVGPRPEATVTAKVYCGRRPIGYVWMHDVLEWFQSRVLFHL
ncbi:MAG: efflux RND transporter periplasmic adaptor subunit, partial [Pirellulales bacterium]